MASPAPEVEQRSLLERARRGDRPAAEQLVRGVQDAVYALSVRMLPGDRARAEDVAQDALLKILEALPRFDPDGPARFSTWALTITLRTAIDAQRRRRRFVLLEPEEASLATAPDVSAAERELGREVEAAMAELDPDQRAILILRAYHDLDYEEIAGLLRVERGTVKSRLSRARAALFARLRGRGVER